MRTSRAEPCSGAPISGLLRPRLPFRGLSLQVSARGAAGVPGEGGRGRRRARAGEAGCCPSFSTSGNGVALVGVPPRGGGRQPCGSGSRQLRRSELNGQQRCVSWRRTPAQQTGWNAPAGCACLGGFTSRDAASGQPAWLHSHHPLSVSPSPLVLLFIRTPRVDVSRSPSQVKAQVT